MTTEPQLTAAVGDYPHTKALKDGRVRSDSFSLSFADIPAINRAFAPMAREQRFNVSEMAIATYFQAKAYGKPLVLLPVVLAARFQEGALLCRADSDIEGPASLAGRRVGVRAYGQTTAMWLRGVLSEDFGVPADTIRWVTFEGAHVAEAADPSWAERAMAGDEMMAMLKSGAVDAVIVGNDVPEDPSIRQVFPDTTAAAQRFRSRHGFMPVNHMLTVTRAVAEAHQDWLAELVDLFRRSEEAAPDAPGKEGRPFGRAALEPAVALALRFTTEQGLLPRTLSPDEVWETSTAGL